MELASALFSSAASSLAAAQKGSLASSYAVDPAVPPLQIGVWKVHRAKHHSNGKLVSVWTADKHQLAAGPPPSSSAGARRGGGARDRTADVERFKNAVEVLKKEASSLSRLRHPCILEMAEPMEEGRSTITFATEPVTASLRHAIDASDAAQDPSGRASYRPKTEQDLELDEVEVQKGLSQLGKGLQFLHESAKLVHGNLTPDAVIINAKGDWKLSGFGQSRYLFDPQGAPARWEFLAFDPDLPTSCQRDYDYIAPEYALDESPPTPSNDMYSLGCILHAIHTHTGPPFQNRHSLKKLRTNLEEGLGLVSSQWRKLPQDVQEVLASLLTRYPNRRLTARQFLESRYFEGLLVGTLRFLERDSFASTSSEAQASFLKGLVSVLPSFSDKVVRRKILPSLLEETRKANLIPFLLPNVLYIASRMTPDDFRLEVLPALKPLFAIKDPPQAVVALIENMATIHAKCSPSVFREEVMPLIYFALESDNPVVLEKALRAVPSLCESLDYTTVKQTLFPKITTVFSRTTVLSVKVNTLICFHSMIKILDKFTLTEKLVPLLAKIKTKEPSVMIATLAVHEEMGKKCEIEAIATLILPQLWAMSIGPLLNVDHFARFMAVIKQLSTRVEAEHSRHLAELKRLEESSGGAGVNGPANAGTGAISAAAVTDFESLVRGKVNGTRVEGLAARGGQVDIFADESPTLTPTPTGMSSPPLPALPAASPSFHTSTSFASPATAQPLRPSAPRVASSFGSTASLAAARPPASPSFAPPPRAAPVAPSPAPAPAPARAPALRSFAPLQPGPSRTVTSSSLASTSAHQPNYNLSLSTTTPSSSGLPPLQPTSSSIFASPPSSSSVAPAQPSWNRVPSLAPTPSYGAAAAAVAAPSPAFPPGYSPAGALQPTVVQRPGQQKSAMDFGNWADLDPLRK
ncbi:hypothetical protein JCM3775_000821 [Rhodotorula graminis]